MNTRKYRAFLLCLECGSITEAAEALNYTQSAVSKMIAELEHEWEMELFIRSKQGVTPTREARQLAPQIARICQLQDLITDEIAGFHQDRPRTLRIGVFASVSAGLLPKALKRFKAQCGNTEVFLKNGEYQEIEEWLKTGEIDCGFVRLPVHSDFVVREITQDRLMAVLPPQHPYADAPFFPIEQLPQETFIRLKEYADNEISLYFQSSSVQPNLAYEVSDDYAILSMVESGLGVSLLHDLVVDTNRFQVVKKPLKPECIRNIGFAYRPSPYLHPSVAIFRDCLCMESSSAARI